MKILSCSAETIKEYPVLFYSSLFTNNTYQKQTDRIKQKAGKYIENLYYLYVPYPLIS
jgi:hypothetical protein